MTHENNSFSISKTNYWTPKGHEETNNKLNEIIEFRPQIGIKRHVNKVKRRGTRIEIEIRGYK